MSDQGYELVCLISILVEPRTKGRKQRTLWLFPVVLQCLPTRGTASEVVGIFSATKLRNTVNDNKIVTPVGISRNCVRYIKGIRQITYTLHYTDNVLYISFKDILLAAKIILA